MSERMTVPEMMRWIIRNNPEIRRKLKRSAEWAERLQNREITMGERVIARPRYIPAFDNERQSEYQVVAEYLKDPDAPSVAEIVDTLKEARHAVPARGEVETLARLDYLIARLERDDASNGEEAG